MKWALIKSAENVTLGTQHIQTEQAENGGKALQTSIYEIWKFIFWNITKALNHEILLILKKCNNVISSMVIFLSTVSRQLYSLPLSTARTPRPGNTGEKRALCASFSPAIANNRLLISYQTTSAYCHKFTSLVCQVSDLHQLYIYMFQVVNESMQKCCSLENDPILRATLCLLLARPATVCYVLL